MSSESIRVRTKLAANKKCLMIAIRTVYKLSRHFDLGCHVHVTGRIAKNGPAKIVLIKKHKSQYNIIC